MQLFGKKKEDKAEEPDMLGVEQEVPIAHSDDAPKSVTNADRLALDVEKLRAQFNSFYELMKATGERFARVNEQVGELRANIIDMERAKQHLEAKATQAIDLVESIQPDKLMIEVRKQDAKSEAVRASLDTHEAMINNVLTELKEMRTKLNSLRGLDETLKLSEQVKSELVEIKKTQALTERHANRVETIFAEMNRNFSELNKFKDITNDLNNSFKKMLSDIDNMQVKIDTMASKKEVEELFAKFSTFEKRTSSIVELINTRLEATDKRLMADMNERMKQMDKLYLGMNALVKKVPDLDKYFQLIQSEAGKIPDDVRVEKIKELGSDSKVEIEEPTKKGGILGNLFKK